MKNILEHDYKSIIKQMKEKVSKEYVTLYKWANTDSIHQSAIDQVWNKLLDSIGAFNSEGLAAKPEYIIMSLYRKGIDKDKVRIRRNCFLINLPNAEYRIYREASGFLESTCKINLGMAHVINGLTADEYAQTLIDFDKIIPEIRGEMQELLLRLEQEQKAAEILEKTARTLIEDFAKLPLSHLDWFINDDDTITVEASIVEVRETQATVTIDELKDKLEVMKTELLTMPRVLKTEEEIDNVPFVGLRDSLFPIIKLPKCNIL